METEPGVPDKVESKTTTKTWIQAYPEISGKSFPMDTVMKMIGQISIEEEEEMNNTINDSIMVPIVPFERRIFEMVDPDSGDLISIDMVSSFINLMKEEHTLIEKMMLLEVISTFRRARYIRKLYKEGLLDVIRPWLSFDPNPEAEALTEVTLSFLKDMWITKNLISNYSFNIGKAIVKVKKNGNETNKQLAEQVQKQWTVILTTEDKPEPVISQEPIPSRSQGIIALPSTPAYEEEYIPKDSVALHTRSRRPIIRNEELDYRKHLRLSVREKVNPDEHRVLSSIRNRRVDRRNKFNIKRHQSNNRCNIKLTLRLNYVDDTAFIRTPRSDVLTDDMMRFTTSTNPDVIDFVSFYAGSYIGKLHLFPNPYVIPDDLTVNPSIRGMRLSHRDIAKILDYLDTGYCGNVVKS